MTSIFDSTTFASYSILTPTNAGTIGGGTTFSLILSDGTTVQVWDVLSTGLKSLTIVDRFLCIPTVFPAWYVNV